MVRSLTAALFLAATILFVAAGMILADGTLAAADILHGVGVMGDSGSVSSPSYKWPAQLQTNRGINFGGSGLPYDHAVGGATSASLLSGGQQNQMKADVQAGKVTLGIQFIGNNDYGSSTALAIANGTATPCSKPPSRTRSSTTSKRPPIRSSPPAFKG